MNILAWHTCEDARSLIHDGPQVMCESGLHACPKLLDTLAYAKGNIVCSVQCVDCLSDKHGVLLDRWHGDKINCRERIVLSSVDATKIFRKFACDLALEFTHLWECNPSTLEYLENPQEEVVARPQCRSGRKLDDLAQNLAWIAMSDNVRDAAYGAAWDNCRLSCWNVEPKEKEVQLENRWGLLNGKLEHMVYGAF